MQLKICHLSKFYKPFSGGIESVVADIAEGSDAYLTSVIATDKSNLPEKDTIKSVRVLRSKEYFSIAKVSIAPKYIIDVIRECNGQIIHVHLPNPLAAFALLIAGILKRDLSKIIIHWHSDIVKQKYLKVVFWFLQYWLLRKSKRIIVTSKSYLDHSRDLSPFVDKCEVIPIGISSIRKNIKPELVRELKDKYLGKKIIFALGRHVYYKGFENLIEASKNVKNAVFLIGGSGPDTYKYRLKIKKLGLEDKVFLIGRVPEDDLPSFYGAADVFCLPSNEKSEAFGVVQLEAMSVGTPVVSANITGSGVPWVNAHMQSGLIFEPNNIDSLAYSLNLITSNSALRLDLSDGAKRRFKKHFTIDRSIKAIHALYEDLLEN